MVEFKEAIEILPVHVSFIEVPLGLVNANIETFMVLANHIQEIGYEQSCHQNNLVYFVKRDKDLINCIIPKEFYGILYNACVEKCTLSTDSIPNCT